MPTQSRVEDIVSLAGFAYDLYQRDQPLRRLINESAEQLGDGDLTLTFEFAAEGRDLRGLIALTDALQLAVDAAAVAVRYDELRPGARKPDNAIFRSLATQPIVTLEIVELRGGSFFGRVKAVFVDPGNRTLVLSVATVASVVVGLLVPPATVPVLVVGGVSAVGNIVTVAQERRAKKRRDEADKKAKHEADAEKKAEKEAAAQREAKMNRRIDEVERQFSKAELRNQPKREPSDVEAIKKAKITRIETRVETTKKDR